MEANQSTDGIDQVAGATQTEAAVEKNDDGHSFENLFDDSTHQFLYATTLKEDGRDIHLGDKLLAIWVLVAQFGLYIYLMVAAAKELLSDVVNVTVGWEDCKNDNLELENFECDAVTDINGPFITGMLFFLSLIASDIAGAVRLISRGSRKAKVTGVVLLVEVFVACMSCGMEAQVAGLQSGAGAILAAVGVAFIHDLDEKVRLVYKYVPKFRDLIALIVFSVVIGVIASVIGIGITSM